MSKADKVLPTLVTFLLDRSSSMGAIWDDTIDGFNAYLKTLKEGGDAIKFTRLQFDEHHGFQIQRDCIAEPISNVSPLDKKTYQPRGSTPLIDAAYDTIVAVQASLEKFDTKHNVVVCIQTDGEENASHRHSWEQLKSLIEEKTKAGWVFNFMGTGIDAYNQSSRMGIAAANTMSTGTTREHVTSSYAAMGNSNMRFAKSGLAASASFTAGERSASGEDDVMQKLGRVTPDLSVSGNIGPLDLAPGAAVVKSPSSSGLDLSPNAS